MTSRSARTQEQVGAVGGGGGGEPELGGRHVSLGALEPKSQPRFKWQTVR